jgi:hypothetical protein
MQGSLSRLKLPPLGARSADLKSRTTGGEFDQGLRIDKVFDPAMRRISEIPP